MRESEVVKKEQMKGCLNEVRVTHPAFGMLSFARATGGEEVLFGSNIKHKDTIIMKLRHGEETRSLHRDWYSGNDLIAEVEMSYSQFAEVISSLNCGSGVPCTIRYEQGKGCIPGIAELENKRDQFSKEFKESIHGAMENIQEQIELIQNSLNEKKSFGIKDRKEMISSLEKVQRDIGRNLDFCSKQFEEQMDCVIRESKGEIEAFCQNKINSIAQMNLVENKESLLETNNPITF